MWWDWHFPFWAFLRGSVLQAITKSLFSLKKIFCLCVEHMKCITWVCMWTAHVQKGKGWNYFFCLLPQNGIVLELCRTAASQTTALASLTNRLKGATTTIVMLFCAWSSSITALVGKLCYSRVLYEKEGDEIRLSADNLWHKYCKWNITTNCPDE